MILFELDRYAMFAVLALVSVCGSTGFAQADSGSAEDAEAKTEKVTHAGNVPVNDVRQALFDKRRTAVIQFVHENQPEMEKLLLALEQSKPTKFRAAINRIEKAQGRLKSLQKRHPERYAASIERWKIKSEIELLTARASNSDDQQSAEARRAEFGVLVGAFIDNRKRMLELEQEQLQRKLTRTERLLKSIESDREALVEKNMRSIEKTIKQLKSGKPVKK